MPSTGRSPAAASGCCSSLSTRLERAREPGRSFPGQVVALLVVSAVAVPEIVRLVRAHQPIRLSTAIRWGLAAGVFGATANLMFLLATGVGQLTVAAILAGLHPAVTVALAAIVLHERIQRVQATGLIAAAAAAVLIVTAS